MSISNVKDRSRHKKFKDIPRVNSLGYASNRYADGLVTDI